MSRFYANVQGDINRKTITKGAHRGMKAHIRGWNIGARIELYIDENGEDALRVFVTGGSNADKPDRLLAEISK